MSWTVRRVHHAASPGILMTSTEFCPTPSFEPTRVDISNGAFAQARSLQDSRYAPPASPPPCSPAAAATCPSSAPRCTRRTSCNRRPAGLVWPWAAPGRASRHRCRWRSLGWLQAMGGKKKKKIIFIHLRFSTSLESISDSMCLLFVFLIGQAGFIWLRVKDDPPSVILLSPDATERLLENGIYRGVAKRYIWIKKIMIWKLSSHSAAAHFQRAGRKYKKLHF